MRDMLGRDLEIHHVAATAGAQKRPAPHRRKLVRQQPGTAVLYGWQGRDRRPRGTARRWARDHRSRGIFGAHPHIGTIRLAADAIPADLPINARISRGIALLAGNRLSESALGAMSVRGNLFPNIQAVSGALFNPSMPIGAASGAGHA